MSLQAGLSQEQEVLLEEYKQNSDNCSLSTVNAQFHNLGHHRGKTVDKFY